MFGRVITGVVFKAGFMGCFRVDTDHRRGIAGNAVILEWEALGAHERHTTMFGGVLCIIREESSEGMDPPQGG